MASNRCVKETVWKAATARSMADARLHLGAVKCYT